MRKVALRALAVVERPVSHRPPGGAEGERPAVEEAAGAVAVLGGLVHDLRKERNGNKGFDFSSDGTEEIESNSAFKKNLKDIISQFPLFFAPGSPILPQKNSSAPPRQGGGSFLFFGDLLLEILKDLLGTSDILLEGKK